MEIKKLDNIENLNISTCPYCNSTNIKEYLYGEPTYDYDKDKYVLGGCILSLDKPKYKCSDCGKDIYIKRTKID